MDRTGEPRSSAPKVSGMLTNSILGMTRRRWQTERPFVGHTKESLQRKLQSPAMRAVVRELVRRELALREQDPIST